MRLALESHEIKLFGVPGIVHYPQAAEASQSCKTGTLNSTPSPPSPQFPQAEEEPRRSALAENDRGSRRFAENISDSRTSFEAV